MITSSARFETQNASRYMQQLLKHFAHKIEVSYDEKEGRAELGQGPAHLRADESGLTVQVSGEDLRAVIEARYVIDKHLVTFAFRDGFSGFSWSLDA